MQVPQQLSDIGIKRIIAWDVETYYHAGKAGKKTEAEKAAIYSLSGSTTEQYVRDKRFETICLTATDGKQFYNAAGQDACARLLKDLGVDRKDTLTLAHNARFEACVGEWRLGVRFNLLVCTMHLMRVIGLSRIIGESLESLADFLRAAGYKLPAKTHVVDDASGLRLTDMDSKFLVRYVRYCANDTLILAAASQILLPMVPLEALLASDMTLKMYCRPVIQLNRAMLEDYIARIEQKQEADLRELGASHGFASVPEFMDALKSKPRLAAVLKSLGVEPPQKVSEKKTATKMANLADPAWVEKRRKPAFLKKLAAEGSSWEQFVSEPVMELDFSKKSNEFKALLEHPDYRVRELVGARLEHNSSIKESRAHRFLACSKRGPLVFPLQYAAARTHRYGADDKLNLQNLPKHGGDKTLRLSMEAPEGWEIGGADSSQVEVRVLAYIANEVQLLHIFSRGDDPYCYMAAIIYPHTYAEIHKWTSLSSEQVAALPEPQATTFKRFKEMRTLAKKCLLGSGYNMSGMTFGATLINENTLIRMPDDVRAERLRYEPPENQNNPDVIKVLEEDYHMHEAQRLNKIYRSQHKAIVRLWRICQEVLGRMVNGESGHFGGPDGKLFFYDGSRRVCGEALPGVRLPNGEWLSYPRLRVEWSEERQRDNYVFDEWDGYKKRWEKHWIYGGALTENITQALAFAILTWQGVRIHQNIPVKGNVHDEFFSLYPVQHRSRVREIYEKWMCTTPPYVPGLPLNCEFSHGKSYGDL